MSGAYTATPEASTPADLPPGWNPIWPHPGPWPPGYTPDLGLGLVAQSTMVPGTAVTAITATLTDQDSYATTEPPEQVNWQAVWDDTGDQLTLKLNGAEDFLASINVSYLDVGDEFWGATPDLEFSVVEADADRTFTLTARSTPFIDEFQEQTVTASSVITVTLTQPSYRVTITVETTASDGETDVEMQVVDGAVSSPFSSSLFDDDVISSGRARTFLSTNLDSEAGSHYGYSQGTGMYGPNPPGFNPNVAVGECGNTDLVEGVSYLIYYYSQKVSGSYAGTYTVKIYSVLDLESTLVETYTKARSSTASEENVPWLNIQIIDGSLVTEEQ